jgi:hypothetical protein|tara:strand:- start:280 stop:1107 length:828 start_codon:yes stop_codon:yes gene_type:complete
MTNNPLQKLFRNKSYYLELPSKGAHYPSGITLSVDNELGIMPMTIRDEIILKSPDVLFNGEALYELFRSCVPDIVNPKEIPQCDIDSILIGIRMAGGKKNIEISSTCPSCSEPAEYELSLGTMLNSVASISTETTITLEDNTVVEVRPYSLETQVKAKVQEFHQHRMQQILIADNIDEEAKTKAFDEAMAASSLIQIAMVAGNIIRVTPDDEESVTSPEFILGWVQNMNKETYKAIIAKIIELSNGEMDNTFTVTCDKCQHEYKTSVDINPVNFF